MIRCYEEVVVKLAGRSRDPNVVRSDMPVRTSAVKVSGGEVTIVNEDCVYGFLTDARVPRTGALIVGLGGNNGTTLAAGIVANRRKINWETQVGNQRANWLGSVAMCGTTEVGIDNTTGQNVYIPIRQLLPMVEPENLVIGGWDISSLDMVSAMKRAKVLPIPVQEQVQDDLRSIPVMRGIYYPDFIATNQEIRADNIIPGTSRQNHLDQIRRDIQEFKSRHNLDKIIVFWSGNTERFADHVEGVHDTAENLMNAVMADHSELAPSLIYAMAAALEGCCYINGSPQNTFCEGLVELAKDHSIYLAGDDLKTGQTKIKSVLADYLVSTGLRPTSICSYNHLGNNDGLNLSQEKQFRSKEITKSSVVDDMILSNSIIFPKDEPRPDHLIVIKYVPSVGDSKRAMDEYTAKIFMNGFQTLVVHNTCEDSLLAAPIILDLILFMELIDRITIKAPLSDRYVRVRKNLVVIKSIRPILWRLFCLYSSRLLKCQVMRL